ncbi:MAG: EI24 domain-containing protein [Calditrichota bacterium]
MFIAGIFKGLAAYFRAHRVIFKHRLWPYLILPGALSVFYIGILLSLGGGWFDDISAYVNTHWIPEALQHSATRIITQILLWLLLLLLIFISYKHVILILFAPILGSLSERTEKLVYGEEPPDFSTSQLFRDLRRGVYINARGLTLSTTFSAGAWLLVFVPIAGAIASTILIFCIQSYYGGSGLIDYALERRRFSVRQSVDFVKQNRGYVLGIGAGFVLLLFIPIIGWFAAPTYGTIAGTLIAMDRLQQT